MANFQLPRTTMLDVNGKPIPGATLYFYLSGTSTPATVYADEANTIPLGTYVVADGAGRFAPIYLATTYNYKVTAVDASGAVLYTADPVEALTIAGASTTARLLQVATTPLDYGAIGDGVANEQAMVQAAINAATGTVDLLGKTFRCDTPLILKSNMRLYNGTLNFSQCTTDHCILGAGTYPAGTVHLNANATVGAMTLTLNNSGGAETGTTGMSAGQWLRLVDGQTWYGSLDCGELVCIKSVDSSTQVTLTRKLLGAYTTGAGALVAALATKSDIRLHDLVVIGAQSVTQSGVVFEYAHKIDIRNVWCKGFYTAGFDIRTCANVDISSCIATNTRDATFGTGIVVQHGCVATTIRGCKVESSTTGIQVGKRLSSLGGVCVNRDVQVSDCYVGGAAISGIAVQAAHRTNISGCEVIGAVTAGGDCITDNGLDTSITNCKLRHAVRYGIITQPKYMLSYATPGGGTPASKTDRATTVIRGNTIEFAGIDAVRVVTDSGSTDLAGIDVSGNSINGPGEYGINVLVADKNVSDVTIIGNTLRDCGYSPVALIVSASRTLSRVTVANNSAQGHPATYTGVYTSIAATGVCVDLNVSNNRLSGGLHGVYVSCAGNASVVTINGNSVQTPDQVGVGVNASGTGAISRVTMAGNIVNAAAGTSNAPCISVSSNTVGNVTDVTIAGNACYDGYHGIQVAGSAGVAVNGNTVGSPSSTGINLSTSSNVNINGNSVRSATSHGISIATSSIVAIASNTVSASGGSGVYVTSGASAVSAITISGNSVDGSTSAGIDVSSGTSSMTGVTIHGNTVTTATGNSILVSAGATTTGVSVSGNTVHQSVGTASAVMVTAASPATLSRFSVASNSISSAVTAPCLEISGDGTLRGGSILANNFVGGNYGISETITGTCTKVIAAANYMTDYSASWFLTDGVGPTLTWASVVDTAAAVTGDLPNLQT